MSQWNLYDTHTHGYHLYLPEPGSKLACLMKAIISFCCLWSFLSAHFLREKASFFFGWYYIYYIYSDSYCIPLKIVLFFCLFIVFYLLGAWEIIEGISRLSFFFFWAVVRSLIWLYLYVVALTHTSSPSHTERKSGEREREKYQWWS